MPACTFFGHRDCPSSTKEKLQCAIVHLIENHGVDTFYVGHQGAFDRMATAILLELSVLFSHIHFFVVLAHLPQKDTILNAEVAAHSLFPEGIETVPHRFAISFRNNWMIQHSDFVIAYIDHSWGGAAQFALAAEKHGKTVLHLA